MRYRLLLLLAVVVACVSLAMTGSHLKFRFDIGPAHAHLPPSPTSYLGVFEPGVPPNYGPVTQFARTVGKQPNLVGYYSGWAQPFPSSFADKLYSHHSIPYVQIDPTYASVSNVAAGIYDDYLRTYADSVRDFGHPVVIGFGHEMNASWYSWGYRHVKARDFRGRVAARRLDSSGAKAQITSHGCGPSTRTGPQTQPIAEFWPGRGYVTWIGIDGYYFRPSDTFSNVFGPTIDQVRKLTNKPILLSETAVGPSSDRLGNITNLFNGLAKYRTLGLVWFDYKNDNGVYNEDWQIEGSSPPALYAFKLGVSNLNLIKP